MGTKLFGEMCMKKDSVELDRKYCSIPFWSWNEQLNTEETKAQVKLMADAGIGGFFMHARGGLSTPYMGKEWFDNVEAAIDEADKYGMRSWAYDENGWPSGFGSGKVNGLGISYQQKYLRMTDEEPTENLIGKSGDHWFYYEINPFYVDTLDKNVIREFIKVAYEPYYEKFGNRIEGFFTDEPQISRNGIPWSFVLEDAYFNRYQEELLPHLEELFLTVNDFAMTRIRFWKLVTDLFSDAFFKQIGEWCRERGLKLTGHLVLEETLESQITTNGACMPHYEYFDIPGMDWLGRNIKKCLTPMQVSSVAEQIGKEEVISETFALCGHNVSFAEMKGIYEWQMVHGINLLCQHLEGYSLRGIRKRDYPPALFYQQPWWDEYSQFLSPLAMLGKYMRNAEQCVDVLVIHPQTTAWTLFDSNKNEGLKALNEAFLDQISTLEKKHIPYHLGDETILERHGKVVGNKLVVGNGTYSYVINSCGNRYLPKTEELLKKYEENGGNICSVEDLPDSDVCSDETISYAVRKTSDGKIHYFVNSSSKEKRVRIQVNGYEIDINTGKKKQLTDPYVFEPWGSLVVEEKETATKLPYIDLPKCTCGGNYRIVDMSENVLTLDHCDYYFDGILQEHNGYVLNIAERAIALNKPVHIKQVFNVTANYVPENIYIVCETPEASEIEVNGQKVIAQDCGFFMDHSFRKLNISGFLKLGDNTIVLNNFFEISHEFYEKMQRAKIFESEKNMLTYERELEAIYIIGDFCVRTDGEWEELEHRAMRYSGKFILDAPIKEVAPKHLEMQGFPFFAGYIQLEADIRIPENNSEISFDRHGVQVVKINLEDENRLLLTDNKCELNCVTAGTKAVRITIYNNLRNMLGPHHLTEGETFTCSPRCFYKEPCVWNDSPEKDWNDGYCFVETSLEIKG